MGFSSTFANKKIYSNTNYNLTSEDDGYNNIFNYHSFYDRYYGSFDLNLIKNKINTPGVISGGNNYPTGLVNSAQATNFVLEGCEALFESGMYGSEPNNMICSSVYKPILADGNGTLTYCLYHSYFCYDSSSKTFFLGMEAIEYVRNSVVQTEMPAGMVNKPDGWKPDKNCIGLRASKLYYNLSQAAGGWGYENTLPTYRFPSNFPNTPVTTNAVSSFGTGSITYSYLLPVVNFPKYVVCDYMYGVSGDATKSEGYLIIDLTNQIYSYTTKSLTAGNITSITNAIIEESQPDFTIQFGSGSSTYVKFNMVPDENRISIQKVGTLAMSKMTLTLL